MAISTIGQNGLQQSKILTSVQMPTGSVIQVVSASNPGQVAVSSTTPVATGIGATITPKFSTSKILVMANVGAFYMAASATGAYMTVFRNGATNMSLMYGGGSNYLTQVYGSSANVVGCAAMQMMDSTTTTTSATTYEIYAFVNSGTAYLNNGGMTTITLMEIAG